MTPQDQQQDARTYRGRTLDELVPQIRRDLGDDAVIVARRVLTSGGVAGVFARRESGVAVVPGGPDRTATRACDAVLADEEDRRDRYARRPPAAPAHRPVVAPEADALPSAADVSVDDLFPAAPPAQAQGFASLFAAGTEAPPQPDPEPAREVEAPRDVEAPREVEAPRQVEPPRAIEAPRHVEPPRAI